MEINYTICQLKDMRETAYGFMGWKFAETHDFKLSDYAVVYGGTVYDTKESSDLTVLEDLFEKFNINRPDNFKGHSLSASDVVIIDRPECSSKYYYCDNFGWKDITVTVNKRREEA